MNCVAFIRGTALLKRGIFLAGSISKAAELSNISRATMHRCLNGHPMSKRTAIKLQKFIENEDSRPGPKRKKRSCPWN